MRKPALRFLQAVAATAIVVSSTLVLGNLLFGGVVAASLVGAIESFRTNGFERAAVVAVAGWTVSAAAWTGSLTLLLIAALCASVLLEAHRRFGLPSGSRNV